MRSPLAIGAGFILVLAGGCGTHQHKVAGTEIDHREIRFLETLPAPYSTIRVAPTLMTGSVTTGGPGGKRYPFPTEAFDGCLGEMLRDSGGFEEVIVETEESGRPTRSGLILQVTLDRHDVTFLDRNTGAIASVAGWLSGLFAIPSWWLHDEEYRVDLGGSAIVTDASTGGLVAEIAIDPCCAEDSLNFHERSGSIIPYLISNVIPPTLVPTDADAVLDMLMPIAFGETMAQLRDSLSRRVEGPPPGRIEIDLPDSRAVTFDFESPDTESTAEGDTLDVKCRLTFAKGCADLSRITVNGEVVMQYDPNRPIPARKTLDLDLPDVPLKRGKIVISVEVLSQVEPVRAVIQVRGE